jgi:hypothetical protein
MSTEQEVNMSEPGTRSNTDTIRCLCGDIRVAVTGAPLVSVYCHCDDCRAVHGAACLPAAIYPFAQVTVVAGEPSRWVYRHTVRATCRTCGTRLYAEPPGEWVRSVSASLLPAGSFAPAFHMQCQHALFPVSDALPHYKGFPALLGGSDEVVSW